MNPWKNIAAIYDKERDASSFPAMLIDDLVVSLVTNEPKRTILDFGAGSGTTARLFHGLGHNVIAYEPTEEMRDVLKKRTPLNEFKRMRFISSLNEVEKLRGVDTLVCLNVVDHISDVPAAFALFKNTLKPKGQLILSIPHPVKNLGEWVKEQAEGSWKYLYYRLDGYLGEREVERNWEDENGNLVVANVRCFHRTMSTYYNWLHDAGFNIVKMFEPAPSQEDFSKHPVLSEKSSRIPLFLVMNCSLR